MKGYTNQPATATRMPWPAYVCNTFEAIPGGVNGATDESLFYGPYNTLLTYLFPPTEFKRPPEGWSINFTTVFIVQRAFHPVFFLEIKPPGDYTHRSSRAAADDQTRIWFFDLADVVSALGTRLCFYSYTRDDNVLDPPRIPRAHERRCTCCTMEFRYIVRRGCGKNDAGCK